VRLAVAGLLLVYAAAVLAAGARWLPRAEWPRWAPRLGIAAWLSGALSVVLSSAGAGVILAVPCAHLSDDPAVLRECLSFLRDQYASPAGAATGSVGAVLTTMVLGRVTWCYGAAAAMARRRRASHGDALVILGRPGPATDVRVIDSHHPAVYCLPGRRRRIVLTTGALTRLDPAQLDAVLAHERAHLSERHHVMLRLAWVLARAFPRVRFFAVAAQQITYLVEVAADDAAVRRAPRLTLAAALLAVATSAAPVGALGAGSAAAQRIERLIDPPRRVSMARRATTAAVLAAAAALAVTTFAIAFLTLIHCPSELHLG
jgi:bla regulator protein blaR1